MIENSEIAVVIDQLGRGGGLAESGGDIVDAADARSRRDELGPGARKRRRDVVLTHSAFLTLRLGEVEQGGLVTLPKRGASSAPPGSTRPKSSPSR